jgi:hypothetical protein
MPFMGESEVARIRESIAASYMAAQWGLKGLAYGTARHDFITARMEQMEQGRKELHTLIGDKAIALVSETLADLPEKPTRYYIKQVLQHELGDTEETNHILDYVQELWETTDMLVERFGIEDAQKIINAPSSENSVLS